MDNEYDFTTIVNEHSDEVHRKNEGKFSNHVSKTGLEEFEETYDKLAENAERRSIEQGERRIALKKKKKSKKKVAIAIIGLAAVISLTVGAIHVFGTPDQGGTSVSEQKEIKNDVKNKIAFYKKAIGIDAENKDIQYEYMVNRDMTTGEPIVAYNQANLVRAINAASLIGEDAVYEVIYAAASITNETCEDSFAETFKFLADDELLDGETYSCLKGGSLDSFLHELGYEDLKEYKAKEVNRIVDIISSQSNTKGVSK